MDEFKYWNSNSQQYKKHIRKQKKHIRNTETHARLWCTPQLAWCNKGALYRAFRGINMDCKDVFLILCIQHRVFCGRFLIVFPGSEGFRGVREAYRIHFPLSWYLEVPVVTSYGQRTPCFICPFKEAI